MSYTNYHSSRSSVTKLGNSHSSFFQYGAKRVIFLLLSAVVEVWIRIRPDSKILDPVHPYWKEHYSTLSCGNVLIKALCCCCWCCNWKIHGTECLVVVVCGLSRASYNPASARSCGTASIVFSVIAIVLGVIFIIILIVGKAAVIYDIPGLESVKFPGSSEVRTLTASWSVSMIMYKEFRMNFRKIS